MPRVVVADDHAFFRDGLVGLLVDSGVDVVDDVPNGAAVVESVVRHEPDVAVVDLTMPGVSGIEVARTLGLRLPSVPVLILTVSRDEEDVLSALAGGARGYVLKDGPLEDLVAAIDALTRGRSYVSGKVRSHLGRHLLEITGGAESRFTPRQAAVLQGVVEGLALRELADRLRLTPVEVEEALSAVVARLQVESRGEIAVGAIRDRIV